jgi:hypothetical protein
MLPKNGRAERLNFVETVFFNAFRARPGRSAPSPTVAASGATPRSCAWSLPEENRHATERTPMPRSRTRVRNRTIDKSANPAWPKARRAQLYREVLRRLKILYRNKLKAGPVEKAPDPETGGFSDPAIPALEPRLPETQGQDEPPARPVTRRTGVTVLTD